MIADYLYTFCTHFGHNLTNLPIGTIYFLTKTGGKIYDFTFSDYFVFNEKLGTILFFFTFCWRIFLILVSNFNQKCRIFCSTYIDFIYRNFKNVLIILIIYTILIYVQINDKIIRPQKQPFLT